MAGTCQEYSFSFLLVVLRLDNWVLFPICHGDCYFEFILRHFKNLKLFSFSLSVKELFEPILLHKKKKKKKKKKATGFCLFACLFFKAFS